MKTFMRWTVLLFALVYPALITGCDLRQNAIAVSNTDIDFSRNETPYTMYIWNNNTMIADLTVAIEPDETWIKPGVTEIISHLPKDATNGPFDKRAVIIGIDRTQLPKGESKGTITLTSKGVKPRTINIRVWMDVDGRMPAMNIVNPIQSYSKPYVIDFSFGLKDSKGNAVTAEPNQFKITALEDDQQVGTETGLQMRRGNSKQLKIDLVMDYSITMQSQKGAVTSMEATAKDILLPALNTEALAGITEFHRDDRNPEDVSDFTIDRAFIRARIDAIQSEIVNGWYSGPRLFDAIVESSGKFNAGEPLQESRYMIVFTAGSDTSSRNSLEDAVYAAANLGIRIIAIGFGKSVDQPVMLDLTGRTGGAYFPVEQIDYLPVAVNSIIDNLAGQYIIRWATLRRTNDPFRPSIQVVLNGTRVTYKPKYDFRPQDYKGDVLRGMMRLVNSSTPDTAAVVLRADYMPRFVREMWLYAKSSLPFTVNLVQPGDDGLIAGWSQDVSADLTTGGVLIHLTSPDVPIPFASFGPLIRFDFAAPLPPDTPLFEEMYFDNSVYDEGIYLVVKGFHNPNLDPSLETE